MAFAPNEVMSTLLGVFIEKECGNYFEYQANDDGMMNEFPHKVWVLSNPIFESGYRYAKVLKTVAYIVVDEDDCGNPVVEKWDLKKNTAYGVCK